MRAPYRGTHSALLCAHTHRFVQTCPRCVHTLVPTIWIGAQLLSVYPSVCTPILAIPPCKHFYLPVHPHLCTPNPCTPTCLHLCTHRVPAVPISHPCTLSCSPHTHPCPAVPLWGHPAVPRSIQTLPHTPWRGLSTLQRLPGQVG